MLTLNNVRHSNPMDRWARTSAFLSKAVVAATLAVGFASSGFAQSSNTVTLRLAGGETVTGELIGFSGDMFQIKSSVGEIAIPTEGVDCVGASCPEGTRVETTEEQMVLTAKDGSATVAGNLIEVADNQYILATDIGEIRVDIDRVDCQGSGCVTAISAPEIDRTVILTGGQVSLEGTLVENLADAYLVDVPTLGLVRVSKDVYSCSGAACP